MSESTTKDAAAEEPIASKVETAFKHDIIKEVLKLKYTNQKNKITDEALELITEITKVMVVEASVRAARQAAMEDVTTISLDHIESVLPQMMLDFP